LKRCSLIGAAEVYITDLKCHLPRIEANVALNKYALEAAHICKRFVSSAKTTANDEEEVKEVSMLSHPGDGWSSSSLPLPPPLPPPSSSSATRSYAQVGGEGCNVKVAQLEWGCDLTCHEQEEVKFQIPFDVVIACEVLHWPALDLFQVHSHQRERERERDNGPYLVICNKGRLRFFFSVF
jgi:hypothetical protein